MNTSAAAGWREDCVEVDSFRIRYLEAGAGSTLVVLHGAGGLRQSVAYDLLAEQRRVLLFETPGFGTSAVNTRSASLQALGETMAQASEALAPGGFALLGHSFGGKLALWLALQRAEAVQALVLSAPAAIWPDGLTMEKIRSLPGYAHPERQPAGPRTDPAVEAKQDALVSRLIGPPRDAELESQLPGLTIPTLVLWGTEDAVIPPETGRLYRGLLPRSHLIYVYDAGHRLDADRPEAFTSVVRDFLNRQDGFLVRAESSLIHP